MKQTRKKHSPVFLGHQQPCRPYSHCELRVVSRSQRRAMIDREEPKLSLVRQCGLLGISRSSLYYLPTEAGAEAWS